MTGASDDKIVSVMNTLTNTQEKLKDFDLGQFKESIEALIELEKKKMENLGMMAKAVEQQLRKLAKAEVEFGPYSKNYLRYLVHEFNRHLRCYPDIFVMDDVEKGLPVSIKFLQEGSVTRIKYNARFRVTECDLELGYRILDHRKIAEQKRGTVEEFFYQMAWDVEDLEVKQQLTKGEIK